MLGVSRLCSTEKIGLMVKPPPPGAYTNADPLDHLTDQLFPELVAGIGASA
jgi:3-polyprenyl-4-hydroxybenzoate decarboxylase